MGSLVKRRHAIAAGIIAAVSATGYQAAAADWVNLGVNTGINQYYYDSSSIRKYNLDGRDVTEVGAKVEYGSDSDKRKQGISKYLFSVEIDCKRSTYRREAYKYIYEDGSIGDVHYVEGSFLPIEPGNMYSVLFQKVCR